MVTLRNLSAMTATLVALVVSANALAYDRLANISTRGQVLAVDGGAMIAGFIPEGTTEKCGVIRANGPSMIPHLTESERENVLMDPKMVVFRNDSGVFNLIASNDNWQDQDHPEDVAIIEDLGLAPSDPNEAAVFGCFQPNKSHTVIIEGKNAGEGGIAIVEVYDADPISEIQGTGNSEELQAQIDELQSQLAALQSQLNGVLAEVDDAKGDIAALNSAMPTKLNDLADVSANPSSGQILGFVSGSWRAVDDEVGSGSGGGSYTDQDARNAVLPYVWGEVSGKLNPVATSGSYADLSGTPNLHPVATSGKYTDLSNQPAIPEKLNDLADVFVQAPVNGEVLKWGGNTWSAAEDETGSGGGSDHPALQYMSVKDTDGQPTIVFAGVNVRVHSNGVAGRGNLFLGNDASYPGSVECNGPDQRTGMHNLVIGSDHCWKGSNNIISGLQHVVDGSGAAVIGGQGHYLDAASDYGVIFGGYLNAMIGSDSAAMLGGHDNMAKTALAGTVVGGFDTILTSTDGTIVGSP